MRNINHQCAATRVLFFVLLVLTLFSAPPATQRATAASNSLRHRVSEIEQESRNVVQFSIRLYRFYKLSTNAAPVQTACN